MIMKAKKNLYEAPATEVVDIVFDFIQDVYDWCLDDDIKFHDENLDNVLATLNALSVWKMPTELIKKIIKGEKNNEDFEELIVNEVLKEYHKSLAA